MSYTIGAASAIWAVLVYRSNARRERARWAEVLYTRFFEKSELKDVREILDSKAGNAVVAELCSDETPKFTDYLNFFELVVYLEDSHQLKKEDVDALFNYYPSCLKRHNCVVEYINNDSKGFERLKSRLSRMRRRS
ncbi:MAG: hypothetical protein WA824_15525 [Candidatus Sulfotelmatobacter sp.]